LGNIHAIFRSWVVAVIPPAEIETNLILGTDNHIGIRSFSNVGAGLSRDSSCSREWKKGIVVHGSLASANRKRCQNIDTSARKAIDAQGIDRKTIFRTLSFRDRIENPRSNRERRIQGAQCKTHNSITGANAKARGLFNLGRTEALADTGRRTKHAQQAEKRHLLLAVIPFP
tara:strand:- start:1273 stop:1788 length:516 start_codon:yes stop_codon:yes gene_type:complete